MILYTIGHGTKTFDEFVALLRAHGVRHVVDVRSFPGSRAHPHFGREHLEKALPACAIAYTHMRELGGRRRGLGAASPNVAWQHEAFRGYADYMMEPSFWNALDQLLVIAAQQPTVIMCSETLWWRCHRRMIADAATGRGVDVRHIMNAKEAAPHRMTSFARITDARVVYD